MDFDQLAQSDFQRASGRAFWRRLLTWLTRQPNALLNFDEVRTKIPWQGQRDLGLREVPIEAIIGSAGRFKDFDRLFSPLQTRTKDRWMSIDSAHYAQVSLPPVELYKMGEIYFVKDGNHRVSVAREHGQVFVDAHVIEISIPVPLTTDMTFDDMELAGAEARFLEETGLHQTRPEARVEASQPGLYDLLREHINGHRYYLGEKLGREASLAEAASSWYDTVYKPILDALEQQDFIKQFGGKNAADLYLWVAKYQWYLRQVYSSEKPQETEEPPKVDSTSGQKEAARQLAQAEELPAPQRLARMLEKATWAEELLLQQERCGFLQKTHLAETRPQAQIQTRNPDAYSCLLEHIADHRWYLGEQRHQEVSLSEAAASWYDKVYQPLVAIIQEQNILEEFPGRGEAELYLWVLERRELLKQLKD